MKTKTISKTKWLDLRPPGATIYLPVLILSSKKLDSIVIDLIAN